MQKPKVIKEFDRMTEEQQEQIKAMYPKGYQEHLIAFTDKDGHIRMALPFETDEKYYLVKMPFVEVKNPRDLPDDLDNEKEPGYDNYSDDGDNNDVADDSANSFEDMD